jgi:hypothetical protein
VIAHVPADTPVTTPVALTVAMEGVELLHVPPPVASLNVEVPPTVVLVMPVIPAGAAVTVTGW